MSNEIGHSKNGLGLAHQQIKEVEAAGGLRNDEVNTRHRLSFIFIAVVLEGVEPKTECLVGIDDGIASSHLKCTRGKLSGKLSLPKLETRAHCAGLKTLMEHVAHAREERVLAIEDEGTKPMDKFSDEFLGRQACRDLAGSHPPRANGPL